MSQFIYTMQGVSKVVPPKRQIIKDISLSFFPGAKIGLLGLNGAGKSTVLKIMAGVDTDYQGEARPQPGIKVGYLPQENSIFRGMSVWDNVMAVAEAYPDLKANVQFLDLQRQLADTENQLAFSRQYYNDAVTKLNSMTQTIPWMFLTGVAGVSKREFYKAPEGQQAAPTVDFGTGTTAPPSTYSGTESAE